MILGLYIASVAFSCVYTVSCAKSFIDQLKNEDYEFDESKNKDTNYYDLIRATAWIVLPVLNILITLGALFNNKSISRYDKRRKNKIS